MFPSTAFRSTGRFTTGIAAICLLLSCGGEQTAGIQGSGLPSVADAPATAVGPISGFGSIFVNGVEYSTSAARISIDDQSGTEAQLRVGQIVTVKGRVSSDGDTGTATEVSFIADARGSVTQLDTDAETFVALGQTVQITDATLFDESIQPANVEGLETGDIVEVSGFADAAGNLVASRIELKSPEAGLQVKGVVEALDTSVKTFRLNALTVNYSGVAPEGTLTNGAVVKVKGAAASASGPLQASSVKALPSAGGAANERGDVQGLITSFASQTNFVVAGQRVATDSNTQFALHDQTLDINLFVKIKGTYNSSGVLVASKVEAKPQSSGNDSGNGNRIASSADIVRGLVDSVTGTSLSVLGLTVTTSVDTTFNDKSQQRLRTFGIRDLRAGDYVEARGAAGNANELRANVIERDNPENRSYLQGAASQVASPNLSVLGTMVATNLQTHFIGFPNNPSGADEFFNQVANHTVKVQGAFSAGTLLADQVQIRK
jgi:hypothetical protein